MHNGHRSRVKRKFMLHGIDNFEDHEILELALFYVIPRKNTNEIAHDLLDKFGSLPNIFDAPASALSEVKGIGESAVNFIKLIPNLARIYMERKMCQKGIPGGVEALNDRLMTKFIGRYEETIAIMLTDAKNKILYEGVVSKGTVNSVDLYIRKIIELLVLYNASGIIMAHNHPSGLAMPSVNDLNTTRKLKQIFDSMNVKFLDHIIVADEDYVSLRDCDFDGIFSKNKIFG